jgi:AAA+ ATPase superfamily predicted ATPase
MFVGREKELEALKQISRKSTSSLIVITGRRRIGKSSLVREFSKQKKRYLEFSGLPPTIHTSNQNQLDEFALVHSR